MDSFETQSIKPLSLDKVAKGIDDAQSVTVGQTISHYEILKKLGEGGMGEVYLARDVKLDREVAFKVLSAQIVFNEMNMRRFEQEAKAASALNHPNILTIYEFGEADGIHFIATEFINGITLRRHLLNGTKRRALSLNEVLDIAQQTASALAAAHTAGIVHRDIKPENIMIRPDGLVKILDFGLAKLATETAPSAADAEEAQTLFKTAPGMVMGTVAYMSPEQARGITVDVRADIWSLGVCVYEMATGHAPFAGATQTDVLVAVLDKYPPKLRNYIGDVPDELERIIDKCLAKNVDERYQVIKDLVLDLKSLKQRLDFETELERSDSQIENSASRRAKQLSSQSAAAAAAAVPDAATQMIPVVRTAPLRTSKTAKQPTAEVIAARKNQTVLFVLVGGLVVVIAAASVFFWQSQRSSAPRESETVAINIAGNTETAVTAAPPRLLNYSLTVQSYQDGRYKKPFQLASEMLFRNKDRVRLSVKSPHTGNLYILNQGPAENGGELTYNILFPSPTTNNNSSALAANQEIQIPQQSWFELDESEGTELVWLVWAENAIHELESARRFANPQDRGRIKDSELVQFIAALLQKQSSNKTTIARDEQLKETQIIANNDIVVHVIKLEHH